MYGKVLADSEQSGCVSVCALRPFCRCRQGYRGPGTNCIEINPCTEPDRGGCHLQVGVKYQTTVQPL